MRPKRFVSLAAAGLAALCTVWSPACSPARAGEEAEVPASTREPVDPWASAAALAFSIRGQAFLRRANGEAEEPLHAGTGLAPGDTVRVGEAGRVRLLARDGTLSTLDAGRTREIGRPEEENPSALWETIAAKFRNLAGARVQASGVGGVRGDGPIPIPPLAPIAPLGSWILSDRPVFRWGAHPGALLYRHGLQQRAEDGAWRTVWQDLGWRETALPYPDDREPLVPGIYRWTVIAVVGDEAFPSGEKGYTFRLPPAGDRSRIAEEVERLAAGLPPDLEADERLLALGAIHERKGIYTYDEAAACYRRVLAGDPGHPVAREALVELYRRIEVPLR